MNHLVKVCGVGYDMYRDGQWVGSRRTLDQCRLVIGDWLYVVSGAPGPDSDALQHKSVS